jgi:DNA polymerase-3 subunit chi
VTEVAFHFGAPDKVAYTCRLLRKAAASGAKVLVLAEPSLSARLDQDLWAVSAVDFVPHCADSASDSLLRHSPIVLTSRSDTNTALVNPVLVQLSHPAPEGVRAFSRVIEVVSEDEYDRAQARQRWKSYAAWGLPIKKHDLALKEQS